MASSPGALPIRILLKFAANTGLVWFMQQELSQYFVLDGDITAVITIGAVITVMNLIVRPILSILTLPLKLFATMLAIIIVNGGIAYLTVLITQELNLPGIQLEIAGGLVGWAVVAVILGLGNWVTRIIMK